MDGKEARLIQETLNLYFNLESRKRAIQRELCDLKRGGKPGYVNHSNFDLIFTEEAQERLRNFMIRLGEEQVDLLDAQMTSIEVRKGGNDEEKNND